MIEYLIVVGGLCVAAAVAIAMGEFRHRRYLRQHAENMERRLDE